MSIQDLMTQSANHRRRQLVQNLERAYNTASDEPANLDGIEAVLNYLNRCLSRQVARDKAQQSEVEDYETTDANIQSGCINSLRDSSA